MVQSVLSLETEEQYVLITYHCSLRLIFKTVLFRCMHVCLCAIRVLAFRGQKRVMDPLALEAKSFVSYLMWVLGTNLGPLKSGKSCNCRAMSRTTSSAFSPGSSHFPSHRLGLHLLWCCIPLDTRWPLLSSLVRLSSVAASFKNQTTYCTAEDDLELLVLLPLSLEC